MSLQLCIFDLDGVIVDTVPLHFDAWKRMFDSYFRKFTIDEYYAKVDGIPRDDGVRAILSDLSDEDVKKASALKQAYFLANLNSKPINTFSSTLKLIGELRDLGVKVVVISSSKNARKILQKINMLESIDGLISGDECKNGKPEPDIFLMAAKKFEVPKENCVVFEDAVLGVLAAKRAGMFCVGIDRRHNPKRLRNADIVVADLSELRAHEVQGLL